MSYIIGVSGKGGTGKTTFSASLVNYLVSSGKRSILAVDADPNSTLAEALGLKLDTSIMQIIENICKNPGIVPQGTPKDRFIEYKVQEAIIESDKFDLLAMGRPEGPGCYCYANNALRGVVEKLISSYDYIVIDNEAGMEHLSRRTTRRLDIMFIISDFSIVGVRSASRINDLIKELDINIKNIGLIINKAGSSADSILKDSLVKNLEIAGTIPFDMGIEYASVKGESIFNLSKESAAEAAIFNICNKFIK